MVASVVAGVLLLLALFGEQFEDSLPLGRVGHGFEQALIMLDILTSDEAVHTALLDESRDTSQNRGAWSKEMSVTR